jgi:hypothetical protein
MDVLQEPQLGALKIDDRKADGIQMRLIHLRGQKKSFATFVFGCYGIKCSWWRDRTSRDS